jgi:hypothetical protein
VGKEETQEGEGWKGRKRWGAKTIAVSATRWEVAFGTRSVPHSSSLQEIYTKSNANQAMGLEIRR